MSMSVRARSYDEFHIAERLRMNGWVVPAYTLAKSNQVCLVVPGQGKLAPGAPTDKGCIAESILRTSLYLEPARMARVLPCWLLSSNGCHDPIMHTQGGEGFAVCGSLVRCSSIHVAAAVVRAAAAAAVVAIRSARYCVWCAAGTLGHNWSRNS